MAGVVEIREFHQSDLDAIVQFSLRAWEPVFASLREVLGDRIFLRLKPDWRAAQAEEVKASCTSDERDAFVAIADGRPVGFVTVALNAFRERMGVIEIIGVDPDFQRRGIASPAHATRARPYAPAWNGHRSRRNWWRSGPRPRTGCLLGAWVHASPERPVLEAARLTGHGSRSAPATSLSPRPSTSVPLAK
jgi:GNAT superfamily N-acetyltransferase